MMLQASRFIFKFVKMATQGKQIPFPFSYINKIPQLIAMKKRANNEADFKNLEILELAFAARAAYFINATTQ